MRPFAAINVATCFAWLVRTEEAVNEVKRQAVAELHRAVTAAEVKATVAVTAERARLEKVVNEVRAQARQEAFALLNSQEDSTEVSSSAENWLVLLCRRPCILSWHYKDNRVSSHFRVSFVSQ